MSYTPEEREAYLQSVIEQRDALLDKMADIQNAYDGGYYTDIQHHLALVWNKFQRPTSATPDLTPEAMLKERIESYAEPKSQIIKDNVPDVQDIMEPKKEPTVEDVFGTSDDKYWIVSFQNSYQIKSDNGPVLSFNQTDSKAQRKAKLALKLLNQAEPDDIDLLIEMLY